MMKKQSLEPETMNDIVEPGLSDMLGFNDIRIRHGLGRDDPVKALMRHSLKSGSYPAWAKRLHQSLDAHEVIE